MHFQFLLLLSNYIYLCFQTCCAHGSAMRFKVSTKTLILNTNCGGFWLCQFGWDRICFPEFLFLYYSQSELSKREFDVRFESGSDTSSIFILVVRSRWSLWVGARLQSIPWLEKDSWVLSHSRWLSSPGLLWNSSFWWWTIPVMSIDRASSLLSTSPPLTSLLWFHCCRCVFLASWLSLQPPAYSTSARSRLFTKGLVVTFLWQCSSPFWTNFLSSSLSCVNSSYYNKSVFLYSSYCFFFLNQNTQWFKAI